MSLESFFTFSRDNHPGRDEAVVAEDSHELCVKCVK